jgi:hypothetical protein
MDKINKYYKYQNKLNNLLLQLGYNIGEMVGGGYLFPIITNDFIAIDHNNGHIIPWVQNLLFSIPIPDRIKTRYPDCSLLCIGPIEYIFQKLDRTGTLNKPLSHWFVPIIWHSLKYSKFGNDDDCCINSLAKLWVEIVTKLDAESNITKELVADKRTVSTNEELVEFI